jgi:threonine dehydratase
VIIAVGGGGMIGGIAGFFKGMPNSPQIIGCSPANSAVMIESVRAGEILELESLPTLSDGTAGGIEADSLTFEPCRTLVDHYLKVSEAEIAAAVRFFIDHHHMLIEGAAGVAVAACLQEPHRFQGRNLAIVICGGNIGTDQLRRIL